LSSIAVIGAGHIGGTLGRKWAAAGHEVTFGARDAAGMALAGLAREAGAKVATIPEAVGAAEVVAFAIPGGTMGARVSELAPQLAGKIVIDAANNISGPVMNSAAAVAAAAPTARYFRAFNSLGWEMLDDPLIEGTRADMFFCGPDGEHRVAVEQLIGDVGLRPVWLGGPEAAETVDGVLRLWLTMVMQRGHSRRLAINLLED
jgi:hypothetical protein